MPRESLLDSTILAQLSSIVFEQGQNLNSGIVTYDTGKYIDQLICLMRNPEQVIHSIGDRHSSVNLISNSMPSTEAELIHTSTVNAATEKDGSNANSLKVLNALFSLASPFYSRAPSANFMFGLFEAETPQVAQLKPRTRSTKDAIESISKPSDIDKAISENIGDPTKQIESIYERLKRYKKVNFWKFVAVPQESNGFYKTVENIFHFSFLIRSGHADMEMKANKLFSKPSTPPDELNNYPSKLANQQTIVKFDYPMWLRLNKLYSSKIANQHNPENVSDNQISAATSNSSNEDQESDKVTSNENTSNAVKPSKIPVKRNNRIRPSSQSELTMESLISKKRPKFASGS